MIERPLMPLRSQIPVIPHFSQLHDSTLLGRFLPDEQCPITSPFFGTVCFIVHAVQYMIVTQRINEMPLENTVPVHRSSDRRVA